MNILFVNNFYNIFAKADCGASQRTMCLIRALAKLGHVDVISFVDDTISNEPNVDVIFSQEIGMATQRGNRFNKFFKLFRWNNPYSIYPENIEKSKIIDSFVEQKHYDYIVIRYVHFACDCGLLKYNDKLIIDIDDDPKDVVLMSLDKVRTLRNRIYTRIYANTIDRVTRYIISHVKAAFYSTPTKQYDNAHFLPNISAYNQPLPPAEFSGDDRNILIVGRYHYLPNAEGLEHFIRSIFPIVKQSVPNVSLLVVGKVIDDELRRLCEKTVGVKLLGFVEDLRDAYDNCHCAIVPLYRGTGTSVKLVEAMSIGRAVVTTSAGARGLNKQVENGVDFILADEDHAFAEGIIRLLSDERFNHTLSDNAKAKMQQYYSEQAFNTIVSNSLNERQIS